MEYLSFLYDNSWRYTLKLGEQVKLQTIKRSVTDIELTQEQWEMVSKIWYGDVSAEEIVLSCDDIDEFEELLDKDEPLHNQLWKLVEVYGDLISITIGD